MLYADWNAIESIKISKSFKAHILSMCLKIKKKKGGGSHFKFVDLLFMHTSIGDKLIILIKKNKLTS